MKIKNLFACAFSIVLLGVSPLKVNAMNAPHMVVEGESWESIAADYNVRVDDLIAANRGVNLTPNTFITIPESSVSIPIDSNPPKIIVDNLPPMDFFSSTFKPQSNSIFSSAYTLYYPQKGDGWYKISRNLGVDINNLLAINNANLSTLIYVGIPIKIPTSNTLYEGPLLNTSLWEGPLPNTVIKYN